MEIMREILKSSDIWFGALLVIAGLVILSKRIFIMVKGTRLVGTVVGFSQERGVLFPVVEFTYEGQAIKLTTGVGREKTNVEIGQNIDITYHPLFKRYVHQEGEKKDLFFALTALLGGAALIVIFLLRRFGAA